MSKVSIEIDLDWINEDMSVDESIKEQVISSLQNRITDDATTQITKALNKTINEKTSEIVDKYLNKTLKNKIEKMKIPMQKGSSWSSEYELVSMSEFVGKKYESFLNQKVFDKDGGEPRYSSDAKVSINEYFINKYLEKELSTKVSKMIQTARKDAEETIIKTLEHNLQTQLSVDIVKRLNIPAMLQNLQDKAKTLDEKQSNEDSDETIF